MRAVSGRWVGERAGGKSNIHAMGNMGQRGACPQSTCLACPASQGHPLPLAPAVLWPRHSSLQGAFMGLCVCLSKVTHGRELGYMPSQNTGNRFPVDSILTVRPHPTLRPPCSTRFSQATGGCPSSAPRSGRRAQAGGSPSQGGPAAATESSGLRSPDTEPHAGRSGP